MHLGLVKDYLRFLAGDLSHSRSASRSVQVSWKSRNRNCAGIFKSLFFVNSKRLKSSRRFSEVRILSEDDPRATEFSQISPTNNRTAEDAPMVFRLICMYPEDYPVCNDLSLCRAPVIRESFAFIMRACQSITR